MSRLKLLYENRYESADINWRLWANFILSSEPHLQDNLINRGPPPSYVHLFDPVQSGDRARLQLIRRTNRVAVSENELAGDELDVILTSLSTLKRQFNEEIEQLENQVQGYVELKRARHSVLMNFETALRPADQGSSNELFERIENADDTEHL